MGRDVEFLGSLRIFLKDQFPTRNQVHLADLLWGAAGRDAELLDHAQRFNNSTTRTTTRSRTAGAALARSAGRWLLCDLDIVLAYCTGAICGASSWARQPNPRTAVRSQDMNPHPAGLALRAHWPVRRRSGVQRKIQSSPVANGTPSCGASSQGCGRPFWRVGGRGPFAWKNKPGEGAENTPQIKPWAAGNTPPATRPPSALAAPVGVWILKTYIRKTTPPGVRKTDLESRPFSVPALAFTLLGMETGPISRFFFRTQNGVVFCPS